MSDISRRTPKSTLSGLERIRVYDPGITTRDAYDQSLTVQGILDFALQGVPTQQSPIALTDAATITPNLALGNYFTVTLGGNRTLTNPQNLVFGRSGLIIIKQDATGNRTLGFGTQWVFSEKTLPTLSTAANAEDWLFYVGISPTVIYGIMHSNVGR